MSFLMTMLEKYYGKRVMVFIDEYDTPFIEAHVGKFYDEIRNGLASMLHNALKTSNSLQYAMLTGIQRVAKENIFSDLNNLVVCTVNDKRYSQYFGFNEDEVKELLNYYGLELNEQVKEMYDGYHIGDNEIYNPWSLINYADTKILEPYWVNTSANKMIKYAMGKADASFKDDYEFMIENGYLDTDLLLETSFFEQSETYSLWGLFVNAGYLTIERKVDDEYHLVVPNREVQREIKALTAYYLQIPESSFDKLIKSLRKSDEKLFKQSYQKLLMLLPSYHDLKGENSYHMMLLGLCAGLSNEYEIKSNREEGLGRCDIILKSLSNQVSYIIEFKYTKNKDNNLDDLANQAVKQIKDNKYDIEIEGKVIYIGLGHQGKQVEIVWEKKNWHN
ncbi:AAA family ATPase [Thomasclavelia sp.]|uniref:PD-(D/E)XK nuclease domain-containing protein n=1 Tax=Thomasclavelia sp. TaxID=3025757 RepID=UPI0025E77BF4|nr:AAA family ATPase [Thomasclavelia sp.]